MTTLREYRRGKGRERPVVKYDKARKLREQSKRARDMLEAPNYWVQVNNAYFNEEDEDVNEIYRFDDAGV